ncbi:hypothetical protein CEXT_371741, partial [Caerostris extrusa]
YETILWVGEIQRSPGRGRFLDTPALYCKKAGGIPVTVTDVPELCIVVGKVPVTSTV